MPLRLDVGFTKKQGQPDYGSIGASVSFQFEVEGGLINDPPRLRESIRKLFGQARDAVDEELAREGTNGHADHSPTGNGGQQQGNGHHSRPASQAQVRAIHAISRRQQLDLATLLGEKFGCAKPEDLSLSDASSLIDDLNGAAQNGGGRQ